MRTPLDAVQYRVLKRYLKDELDTIYARQGMNFEELAKPLAVMLLLETGARTMEILGNPLKLNGLYWKDGVGGIAVIKALKNSKDRHNVPVSRQCFDLLKLVNEVPLLNYVSARDLRRYFNNLTYKLFKEVINLHRLRHTYCHRVFAVRGNIVDVMVAAGHKSMTSSAQYLNDIEAEEIMRKAFKAS